MKNPVARKINQRLPLMAKQKYKKLCLSVLRLIYEVSRKFLYGIYELFFLVTVSLYG